VRLIACSYVHAGFSESDHNTFFFLKKVGSASVNKSDVYCEALIEFYRLSNFRSSHLCLHCRKLGFTLQQHSWRQ